MNYEFNLCKIQNIFELTYEKSLEQESMSIYKTNMLNVGFT